MSGPRHPLRPLIRVAFQGPEYLKPKPPPLRVLPSQRIENALATPTWSVRSLLPPTYQYQAPRTSISGRAINPAFIKDAPKSQNRDAVDNSSEEITRDKLRHLLNLSALPLPRSDAEENSLLNTLRAQIHFVREIQKVDTTGVEPLRAIRDETDEHVEESTVTLDDLRDVFDQEEVVGRNGRIRRKVLRDTEGNEVPVVDKETERAQRWNCFAMGEVPMEGENGDESLGEERQMTHGEVPGRRLGRYFVVRKDGKMKAKNEPMNHTAD